MTTGNHHRKTIGVILCGSGFKDGSEIHESVATLWALSQHGVTVRCFAPDAPQSNVVNCLTGEIAPQESRNMLVEAARIARGQITPLSQLQMNDLDALILPGGFGAAKNLCDFALKGSHGSVRADLQTILEECHQMKKPIGAICIAPAVVALAFKGKNLKLTLGSKSEASQEIEKLGHRHQECAADACVIDMGHKIVTTPAYMHADAPLFQIVEGIHKLVTETLRLA